jgi:FeS assembly SUF system protein
MEEKEKNEEVKVKEGTDNNQQESAGEKDYSRYSIEEVKEEAVKVLKTIFDPEIPVNIYELGLNYDIIVATNKDVLVIMTLTSPSCPVAGTLPGDVEQKLKEHPMIHDAKVQLTFDPPWNQKMMSEEAKLELGFL